MAIFKVSLHQLQNAENDSQIALIKEFMIIWKVVGSVFLGGIAGLAYQRLVGCSTGSCPLTSNPWISTLYGAAMGLMLSLPR